MALWAMGDMHLTFAVNKDMTIFSSDWKHHVKRIQKNFSKKIKPDDTIVLTGDHSWGKSVEQCMPDFEFIEALPGRKILLRGNHDMFWDAKKPISLTNYFRENLSFCKIIFTIMMMWHFAEQKAIALKTRTLGSTISKLWREKQSGSRFLCSLQKRQATSVLLFFCTILRPQ